MDALTQKIEVLRQLTPGWDSFNAVPPSPQTLDQVLTFCSRRSFKFPPLEIVAAPDGNVVVLFQKDADARRVEFSGDNTAVIRWNDTNIGFEGYEEKGLDELCCVN